MDGRPSPRGLARGRCIGASSGQVAALFLAESAGVALAGGVAGLGIGLGIGAALRWLVPGLPIETPLGFVLAALGTSLGVGLLSGVLPARPAARRDPIEALRAERGSEGPWEEGA